MNGRYITLHIGQLLVNLSVEERPSIARQRSLKALFHQGPHCTIVSISIPPKNDRWNLIGLLTLLFSHRVQINLRQTPPDRIRDGALVRPAAASEVERADGSTARDGAA